MLKINKKYYLIGLFWITYGQTALAEFQALSSKEAVVDIPTANTLNNIIHFTGVGLALSFVLFILLLITSGIYFITAGGDEVVLETAHGMWRIAVFGLISTLIGYIVINLIKYFI